MRIAVLGSMTSWYAADLRRAAGDAHTIVGVTFHQLASSMGGASPAIHSGDTNLTRVDALLVRCMPPGSLEQVVFRMDALAQLELCGVPVINSPKSMEAAIDKYLATARLQQAGLATPATAVCQTASQAQNFFAELGGDVVVKPLFGGEGRGITRVSDPSVASRVFKALEQIGAVIYLQQFVPHNGADLRLLVVGERIFGMRRCNHEDWRTNVSRGARTEPLEVTSDLAELARRAAAAVGAEIAGVDLLPGLDGRLYALEVNAAPGWKALAKTTGVDIAGKVLEYVGQRVASGGGLEQPSESNL